MNVGPGTFMTVRRFIYSAITTNLITRAPTTTAAIAYRISENIRKQNQQQRIYKQLAWSSKMLVILESYLNEQNKRTTKIMGFKPSWLKDEFSTPCRARNCDAESSLSFALPILRCQKWKFKNLCSKNDGVFFFVRVQNVNFHVKRVLKNKKNKQYRRRGSVGAIGMQMRSRQP